MKTEKFPIQITEKGVTALIRKAVKVKGGKKFDYYIVEYILLGKRKQVWRSDLAEAKAIASEACIKVANGNQSSLEFRDTDRLVYARAVEFLSPTGISGRDGLGRRQHQFNPQLDQNFGLWAVAHRGSNFLV